MKAFLTREIDAAEAMIYNEYAQVLEATDPAPASSTSPSSSTSSTGTTTGSAMLQDAIFARKAWLDKPGNRDIAVRFVRASLKGWIYCRDHPDDCIQYTIDAGSQLGGRPPDVDDERDQRPRLAVPRRRRDHRSGVLGSDRQVAKNGKIIKADPSTDAYTTDIVEEALAGITDDTKGASFKKGTVEVTPGGK